jgi:hypothetical protein
MRGCRKDMMASEAQSGRHGERRRGGFPTGIDRRGGEDGTNTRAHASAVDREKKPRTEGVNQRRKRTFAITPMVRVGRAAWASLRERREASGAGWANG